MRRVLPSLGTLLTIVVVVVIVALAVWPTSDSIYLPAPALNIDPDISIAGHPLQSGRGKIFITFVDEPRATLLTQLVQSFNPDASIYSQKQLFGNGPVPSSNQLQQQSVVDMNDSKRDAPTAAFIEAGYKLDRLEVVVEQVDPAAKAAKLLRPGDIIASVSGHVLTKAGQLQAAVAVVPRNGRISLGVQRNATTRSISVPLSTVDGHRVIGILLSYLPKVHNPPRVTIRSGDIEGPSAGLMFALAVYNRLSPTDLTHGYRVAGTGEIDALGDVSEIGGVKQKIIGAKDVGARYFFVPAGNYAEAKHYAHGITLVKVSTLDDAVRFLKHIH